MCHFLQPQNCSTPGFPVLHYHLEFAQIHVHWVSDVIQASHLSVVPSSSCPQSFPTSGSCPMSQLFASGGQSIEASASASVLPMNIQGWFPSGWTGLISLLSKGFSRVFSSTVVQKYQFFGAQPSLWSNSHIHVRHDYWKNHSLTRWTFVGKVMSLLFKTPSRFDIAILPRSKCILILWLQSPSALILEPKTMKPDTVHVFPHLFAMKW